MRSLASSLVSSLAFALCAGAQTPGVPSGDYHFVQMHLRGSRKPLARNLGGSISIGATGSYRIRASMGSAGAAAQPLNLEGTVLVSAGGSLSIPNPARADTRLRLRTGDGGRFLLGSTVDSGEEDYDLFVAVKAGSVSNDAVRGQYGGALLTLAEGNSAKLATGFVSFEADGAGSFPRTVVDAHQAAVDDSMRREQLTGSTYSVRSDGTGAAVFAEGSEVLSGTREMLVAPGGSIILAFSTLPAQRDILIAVRKNPEIAPFLFRGGYWIAELLGESEFVFNPDGGRFGAAAGTIASNGEGVATVAERIQMAGRRTNLTTLNRYFLGTGGASMFGPALRVGLENFALSDDFGLFAGSQVGEPGELVLQHGIFVGVRQSRASGTGVFLDPSGVSNSAASGVPGASISPGSLVSLQGNGLASAETRATGEPLAELGGVRVTFNGDAALLRSVSNGRIEAVAPANLAPGIARIQAIVSGRESNVIEADVSSTSPAVFSGSNGSGWAAAFHPDFAPMTPGRPAVPGETAILMLAGLGAGLNDLGLLFAGRAGEIEFAGAMPGFVGVYQVNVKLPDDLPPGDSLPVAVRTADSFSDLTELPIGTARQ